MTTRQTWIDKVTDHAVDGMTYEECAAVQAATNFEGEQYAAKLAIFRSIATEMGLNATSGSLCHLHARISSEAIKHISRRRAFGG